MCRIAYFSQGIDEQILQSALTELEQRQGGHGNGYFNLNKGFMRKGIALTVDHVVGDQKQFGGSVLFHTRLRTHGEICDELCHPFKIEGKDGVVIVHNGVWYDHYFSDLEAKSDTQTASKVIAKYGFGALANPAFEHSGVWLIAHKDGILVANLGGTFRFAKLPNGGWFHASHIPEAIRSIAVEILDSEIGKWYYVNTNDGSVMGAAAPAPVSDIGLRELVWADDEEYFEDWPVSPKKKTLELEKPEAWEYRAYLEQFAQELSLGTLSDEAVVSLIMDYPEQAVYLLRSLGQANPDLVAEKARSLAQPTIGRGWEG